MRGLLATVPRLALLCASVLLVAGGLVTDLIGLGLAVAVAMWQMARRRAEAAAAGG